VTGPVAGKRAGKPQRELSKAALEAAALRYLDRFDCTAVRLRSVLARRIPPGHDDLVRRNAKQWIDELVERYQASGLLDDLRFARNCAEHLRERGASRRAIQMKLRARGVSSDAVEAVLSASAPNDELAAAQAFAKRRRLGPHRPSAERADKRQKDLAAMARAGFDRDTALRAISHGPSDDDEL
jgi:regulatory protein